MDFLNTKTKEKHESESPLTRWRHRLRGTYDKFPDFFRMGTFIDGAHMKLWSSSK